jgi:hypothetical protein
MTYHHCSFCHDAGCLLVAGLNVYICQNCVALAVDAIIARLRYEQIMQDATADEHWLFAHHIREIVERRRPPDATPEAISHFLRSHCDSVDT